MKEKNVRLNQFAATVTVFLQPLNNLQFNAYHFCGGVSTMDSMDNAGIKHIVHKYKDRFKEAWEELSER